MKEVPMRYVKANQAGIVLFVIASLAFHEPWVLVALWLIQVIGFASEGKLNPFVALAKQLFPVRGNFETQAVELQRFNNTLAILFLTFSLLSWVAGWTIASVAFAAMLLIAASVALLGYCIGCTLYYQYKQLLARSRARHS